METHCKVCGVELTPNLNNDVFSTCDKCRTFDLTIPANAHAFGNIGIVDSLQLVPPNPAAYRLRRDSYGGLILQGLFAMQGNPRQRIWKDIPIVDTDLPEEAE